MKKIINKILLCLLASIIPLIIGWGVWLTSNVYSFQETTNNQIKIEEKIDKLITKFTELDSKFDSKFTELDNKLDSFNEKNNAKFLELWKQTIKNIPQK